MVGSRYLKSSAVPERLTQIIDAHKTQALAVKYNNIGETLATCGGDCQINIWETSTGSNLAKFENFEKPVLCIDYKIDGRFLFSGSTDGKIKIFDLPKRRMKQSITDHTHPVNCISALRQPHRVISGGADRCIKVWNYEKNKAVSMVFFL